MGMKGKVPDMRPVILVSAPWALFNRPSIQLGALKAFLRQCFPELEVHAVHLHLQAAAQFGFPLYQAISERTWIAESIAAALLFPEKLPGIERLFAREGRQSKKVLQAGLKFLTTTLDTVCQRFIAGQDWDRFGLAGFSISLCQLTCSLLLIRRIKQAYPGLPIVVGGSTLSGTSLRSLAALFPEIDRIVQGEGELALTELVETVGRGNKVPGQDIEKQRQSKIIHNLDTLPVPDYDDYFAYLHSLEPEKQFFPVLPVEASRGCWWQARKSSQDRGACAFCNLNLQWQGYRSKSSDKIAADIDLLTSKHKVLSVAFMDNLLPRRKAVGLFANLAGMGKEFRLFGETRADTPVAVLQAMRQAGMRELQVGIEALSTSLLSRLRKGTSTLQNIEVMRHCEALGIHHGGNLLMHFPGSTALHVQETLANMEIVSIYRPLKPVSFWLGFDSPVFRHPDTVGIRLTGNHANWAVLFPDHIQKGLRSMVQGYQGDQTMQHKLWSPVISRLRGWAKAYQTLTCGPDAGPILGYQDGREFLLIIQRRPGTASILHRLSAMSRAVYLYCRTRRSRKRIQAEFSSLPADKLDGFLRMMQDKRLMFCESEKFLSLAVPLERGMEDMELS
jgi:ribosomal peptide maturation radical SAM protein 1